MQSDILIQNVLSLFELTQDQKQAAKTRGRDIAVTAGAGSGKTSTLVARYTSLLADGLPLRSVVAITFTEKAALEMRSRVRLTLRSLIEKSANEEELQFWSGLNAQMDSARIGTIHSLCMEILRAHPVEALIDPKFSVIDEADAATLKIQLVDDTLAELVDQAEFRDLFRILNINTLKALLLLLINKRLETVEAVDKDGDVFQPLKDILQAAFNHPNICGPIGHFQELNEMELIRDAGEKQAEQIEGLLTVWKEAENALTQADIITCAQALYRARREFMKLTIGKRSGQVRESLQTLQIAYDLLLNPICGGKDAKESPPDRETEEQFKLATELVKQAFHILLEKYQRALQSLGMLDFDDLEQGAMQILKKESVRQLWNQQISSILVDEFQDTNDRQRKIVYALAEQPGKLFVVGDAKQSIYRFRSADVTVFRRVQQDILARGGIHLDLDKNFRTHAELLDGMGSLLKPIMQPEESQSAPYFISYEAMQAHFPSPPDHIRGPFFEFVIGIGEKTKDGRTNAARGLARRLHEMRMQGEIKAWDDVTLLFRASSGFSSYEQALEDANIPFVTVSGRGFYDRPEIRDVLNILRALTDPSDDLAMAGLLRSPAFGLSDTALYQLRWQNGEAQSYWKALQGEIVHLSATDQQRATRCRVILNEILPLVDRIPVAEILKRMIDVTDYRAMLAIGAERGTGGRLWRNLDKLLGDARDSKKVIVREFLDTIATINDAGVREGEAPSEAQGAVRLMTIHKSKGLQFPIVVLADASREPLRKSEEAYLLPETGMAVRLDPTSMLYRLAKKLDQDQENAENLRMLYVAMTRAQNKLILNGHATQSSKGGWNAKSWLGSLISAADLDLDKLVNQAGDPEILVSPSGQALRAVVIPPESQFFGSDTFVRHREAPDSDEIPLYLSLLKPEEKPEEEDESASPIPWQASVSREDVHPTVIGLMVHKAIEMWCFPDNPSLTSLLDTFARANGLSSKQQIDFAIQQSILLLTRFRQHPIFQEIEQATQRFHEVPYSWKAGDYLSSGFIDLLYYTKYGWQILEFKTDAIHSDEQRRKLIEQYQRQINKYRIAASNLLKEPIKARLCFLDDRGGISLN